MNYGDPQGNRSAGSRGWGPAFGICAVVGLMLWNYLVKGYF
jgi:hypothetical protein